MREDALKTKHLNDLKRFEENLPPPLEKNTQKTKGMSLILYAFLDGSSESEVDSYFLHRTEREYLYTYLLFMFLVSSGFP